MKTLLTHLFLFFLVTTSAFSQTAATSLADTVTIVKAEDARRYDRDIEKFLTGKYSEKIVARALLAAGRIGDESALPRIVELLQNGSPNVRTMAAFAIGEIESTKGADAILSTLGSASPDTVRGRAVEAAGKIAAANAKDPKAQQLGKLILETLKDPRASTATHRLALTAALRARPAGADDVVRTFLAHSDPAVVADALNTLARLRAKNANRDARDLLSTHVHAVVRANAARVLGAAEDKDAVDVLTKAATSDADSRVRVAAIRSLAALREAKAADALLQRGEELLAAYKKTKKPDFIPDEQNEFIEIATTLGRLLTNTRDERAIKIFREFGALDRGFATEVYVARIRVDPGPGDNRNSELVHWRQYSSIAQVAGEFATLEPTTDQGKRMKSGAPEVLRPLANAYAEADPKEDADTIMAGPDVLRAYARYKTADLSEVLRKALTNKDLFIRATAAELLAEQPVSQDNLDSLNLAFDYAIINDTQYNDAVLATIDALFKLDKRKSLSALAAASGSLDHVVRAKVLDLLKDEVFKDSKELPAMLQYADANHQRQVRAYSGKGTKLGQILNKEADYRRAIARKNGTVRAVLATQKGAFTIELLPEDAPLTVDNFINLARSRYFDGLEVHRLVPNFVMQDGDPRGDGNGGPGWSIRCEMNMVPYERGAVGMALSGKDTGGSQWFVTHSPQPHLDGGYTVFGSVNEVGMKVVDRIVRGDKILSVKIVEGVSTQRPRSTRRIRS